MAIGKDLGCVKVQIFLAYQGRAKTWVPYKILIGYARGRQVIVDDRGEHLYDATEYATREAAQDAAKAKADRIMRERFPAAARLRVEYDVVEEPAAARRP